ncbi:MAG: phage holin family protein [cyanobacterium endosymbiont of Rhopalodia gibba]
MIVARLPIGLEVNIFFKTLVSAIVKPILLVLTVLMIILIIGVFLIILNTIIFGLAAALVQ